MSNKAVSQAERIKRILSIDHALLPNASEDVNQKITDYAIKSLWEEINDKDLKKALIKLGLVIQNHKAPQVRKITEWLGEWSDFLAEEDNFRAKRYYKRGDIIHAHFGYKVGRELGGTHHALVIENENDKSNGTIIVIPLSSLTPERTRGKTPNEIRETLDKSEVYIGPHLINKSHTIAKISQICALSKVRILSPKLEEEKVLEMPTSKSHIFDEIDKKLAELGLKKGTTLGR